MYVCMYVCMYVIVLYLYIFMIIIITNKRINYQLSNDYKNVIKYDITDLLLCQ